jgi:hypothetical protein
MTNTDTKLTLLKWLGGVFDSMPKPPSGTHITAHPAQETGLLSLRSLDPLGSRSDNKL